MSNSEDLTYYEYWLTKESWPFEWAIRLIADYAKFKRPWEISDNYYKFVDGIIDKVTNQIITDRAEQVFTKIAFEPKGEGLNVDRLSKEHFLAERSEVSPKEFLEWVYSKGYQIPYEFKVFIGIEEKQGKITQKDAERIDKAVIQGIGRTLWDIDPEMKNDAMQEHRAIQIYGGGKGYPADTTLQRWLREVDTRKNKTGPKKKS